VSTYLTKVIDARATNAFKALMVALLIVATAMVSLQPVAAKAAPDSFADLVEELSPAVVNISTVQTIERRNDRRRGSRVPEGVPFGEFWEQFRDRFEEDDEPRTARSLGSGFIIDESGIVITNNHVIEEADEITVRLKDDEEYEAEVIGRDELSDIAVLRIKPNNGEKFPFVKLGDSDTDRIGDWVMAIGNPFGFGGSVSVGIISARGRSINAQDVEYIQTDAPINRGNSGGPLFNMKGEVIGVNTAIVSPTGGNVGIGFSVPSNDVKRVAAELQAHGKVRRGWLGVGIGPMTKESAEALGIDFVKGAIINRVEPDSPAEAAGIEVGDIIISWDGKKVDGPNSLSRAVKRTMIDQPADVVVIRGGEEITLKVTTGELKQEYLQRGGEDEGEEGENEGRGENEYELVEGMELAPMNDRLRRRYNIDGETEGVVVTRVARRSPAYRAGIRPGAIIMRVNQARVESPAEVADIVESAREDGRERVLVLVSLRGNTAHIPLRLLRERDENEEE
jgi:serine protease Do